MTEAREQGRAGLLVREREKLKACFINRDEKCRLRSLISG